MHAKEIPPTTRQRLLTAAAAVFAEKGLVGATTREIAGQAQVNEVTLFRHFQSKENLLAAVLQSTFEPQDHADASSTPAKKKSSDHPACHDLRSEIRRFAHRYEKVLRPNLLLLRTLLGEIHRHREHETRVLHGIFAPLKDDLVAAIRRAKKAGEVRRGIDPVVAADLFSGTVFMGLLRESKRYEPEYSAKQYLETSIEIFARGMES